MWTQTVFLRYMKISSWGRKNGEEKPMWELSLFAPGGFGVLVGAFTLVTGHWLSHAVDVGYWSLAESRC